MSSHSGPRTVGLLDGLVLNLDSQVSHSHPGTGSTWFDLSPRYKNNVTLSGTAPTYIKGKAGGLVFDGTTNYADFYAPDLTGSVITVEVTAKVSSLTSTMLFGFQSYDVYGWNGNLGYNTANSDVYGIPAATVTSLGLLNNWRHYIFEMWIGIPTSTSNKIYVNGINQTLSLVNSTVTSPASFNGGNGRISGWKNDTGYKMPMTIGIFKVYNRALSQAEITQNFNAIKGRYGI